MIQEKGNEIMRQNSLVSPDFDNYEIETNLLCLTIKAYHDLLGHTNIILWIKISFNLRGSLSYLRV